MKTLIALGSNLGNSQEYINLAIQGLAEGIEIKQISNLYYSEPMYVEDQPRFMNAVLWGNTELSAKALLSLCQSLEKKIGRVKNYLNGPRVIDIDIILYGDEVLSSETLSIPHPRYHERAFVLVPAVEIISDWNCPLHQKTIQQLHDSLDPDIIKTLAKIA